MADQEDRIFTGTLITTTDNFLLKPPGNDPFIDLDFTFFDDRLDHQDISVLGHLGERKITDFTSVRSIIAKNVVAKRDIAVRAYEIYESGEGGTAEDHWLRAERQLLTTEPLRARAAGA
jgi:hypothetical protein